MNFFFLLMFLSIPLAAAESPLSFEAALKTAIDRSPEIEIQRQTLEGVESKNLPQRLHLLPSVSLKGTQSYGSSGSPSLTQNSLRGELTAKTNIFRFGADSLGVDAANADEKAESLQLAATTLQREEIIFKALTRYLAVTQEERITRSIFQTQEEVVKVGESRFKQGLLHQQEVDRSVLDRENARANLREVQTRVEASKAELVALVGHAQVQTSWPWRDAVLQFPAPQADTNAFLNHPEVKLQQARYEGADARVDRAWRTLFPTLDAQISYGYGQYNSPSYASEWSGMIYLSIPLFERLTTYSEIGVQSAERGGAEMRLEKARREARQRWEASQQAFQLAQASVVSRQKILETTERLFRASLQRFQKGLTTVNDLLVDQNRLYQTELLSVRDWTALYNRLCEVCHAAGKRVGVCLAE